MTAVVGALGRGGTRVRRGVSNFWSGISAVSIKELRGRMRGRRAFAVLTIYLLLLGLFAFAIYVYLKQQAATVTFDPSRLFGVPTDLPLPGPTTGFGGQVLGNGTALSAGIGHGIFGGLLLLETLLVLVLAPAFTSGAISLEREKQTLDLLVTTPLSTLGLIIGKLFSALVYVLLLIVASIPLASLVFVFGAVAPEDLVRAYVFLFALAFGMGAIGMFVSALVRRTQTATVVTFVLVLVLSIGTAALHQFWRVATTSATTNVITPQAGHAPEAALWLNPLVADLDMICATSPDAYHVSCDYISTVTGRPYFGSPSNNTNINGVDFSVPNGVGIAPAPGFACPAGVPCKIAPPIQVQILPGDAASTADQQTSLLGFPRDTFWPKSAAAFALLGIILTLLSAQLIAPSRRLRLPVRLHIPRPRIPRRKVSEAA